MSEEDWQEVRDARAELERQASLIKQEMLSKTEQGIIWSNGECAAWKDYRIAYRRLDELRNKHGV